MKVNGTRCLARDWTVVPEVSATWYKWSGGLWKVLPLFSYYPFYGVFAIVIKIYYFFSQVSYKKLIILLFGYTYLLIFVTQIR